MRPVSVKPGDLFERLTIVSVGPVRKTKAGRYLSRVATCVCVCGRTTEVEINSLKTGNTKSCGCLLAESTKARATKHGRHSTATYKVWSAMVQRCTNPKNPGYKNYGGRGITVDQTWLAFENFYRDMGDPPQGMSLDRIDNDSTYNKYNCRWTDRSTQAHNKRAVSTNPSGVRGVSLCQHTGLWRVRLRAGDKSIWGGRFTSLEQAREKRQELERIYWEQS